MTVSGTPVYLTCRYVFTCHNIDSVDPALNSRCFLIRITHPTKESLMIFTQNELSNAPLENIEQLVCMSKYNINTLKHLIMFYKKYTHTKYTDFPNIVKDTALYIEKEMTNITNLSTVHSLAEKYHTSELCILDICKYMNHIDGTAFQQYSSKLNPSLYDTILLFCHISKPSVECV